MSFHFSLKGSTPFVDPDTFPTEIKSVWWKLSENKNIEAELQWDPRVLFDFGLDIRPSVWYNDHAGFMVGLGLFGLWANFTFYDKRHALRDEEDDEVE